MNTHTTHQALKQPNSVRLGSDPFGLDRHPPASRHPPPSPLHCGLCPSSGPLRFPGAPLEMDCLFSIRVTSKWSVFCPPKQNHQEDKVLKKRQRRDGGRGDGRAQKRGAKAWVIWIQNNPKHIRSTEDRPTRTTTQEWRFEDLLVPPVTPSSPGKERSGSLPRRGEGGRLF